MNWSTVWELIKINILYSSPQSVTAAKRKQERKPSKGFSAYAPANSPQPFVCGYLHFYVC